MLSPTSHVHWVWRWGAGVTSWETLCEGATDLTTKTSPLTRTSSLFRSPVFFGCANTASDICHPPEYFFLELLPRASVTFTVTSSGVQYRAHNGGAYWSDACPLGHRGEKDQALAVNDPMKTMVNIGSAPKKLWLVLQGEGGAQVTFSVGWVIHQLGNALGGNTQRNTQRLAVEN